MDISSFYLILNTTMANSSIHKSWIKTPRLRVEKKKVLCFFSFDFWAWDYKTAAALIFFSSSHKCKAGYFYFSWNLTCLFYHMTCRSSENRHWKMTEVTKPAVLWLFFNTLVKYRTLIERLAPKLWHPKIPQQIGYGIKNNVETWVLKVMCW